MISLFKGQKVDLTKNNPGLSKILVGLGWDVNKYDGQADFDLDAAAFLLGANGKVQSDSDFVFYNNKTHSSGSVTHLGDNRTGAGEGDDEQIKIDLSKVPASVEKISFIHVMDEANGTDLIRYDLGEDFSVETAVVVAELYRNAGEWKFNAIGSGFKGGLKALCENFGVNV